MLSRIAESLYWIGRLVERAEDTARLLEVHLAVALEDAFADDALACAQVCDVLGLERAPERLSTPGLVEAVGYAPDGPITGSLLAARENARTVREAISSELWEALNTTRNSLVARSRARRPPPDLFAWVRLRTSLVAGLVEGTLSRDDGWLFLVLGRSLERVDMTARILSVAGASHDPMLAAVAVLRACGAFEAYLRTYRAAVHTRQAAEFLLLDRLFPRSVYASLTEAEHCLKRLTPAPVGRTGVSDPGLLALGRARALLEYADRDATLRDPVAQLRQVQDACLEASTAVSRRFFDGPGLVAWSPAP